jgi:glycosyltransferase involved in cell wall biosynthesis/SAM-dependent methyltransferase
VRVLVLAPTPYFSLRGTPIAVRRVLQFLSAKGCEVEVLTFPFGEDREMPGVTLTRCGRSFRAMFPSGSVPLGPSWRKALLDLAMVSRFGARLVRSRTTPARRYDCIHAVDELALGCWLLGPLVGSPVIYDMDSSLEEQFSASRGLRRLAWLARCLERRMVSAADAVLVVSAQLAERVESIDPSKAVHVLPDRPLVTAAMVEAARSGPSPLPEDVVRPLLLYVGNLGAHQGVAELVRALEFESTAGLRCSLAIAGGAHGVATRLRSSVAPLVFLGELPPERLAAVYAHADILVAPRQWGSNPPMKVYEYLEVGSTILATRVPGHRLLEGHDAVVWADPDVEGLRAGLRSAVGDWRRGRTERRTSELAPGAEGPEPVLEEVYAQLTGRNEADSVARSAVPPDGAFGIRGDYRQGRRPAVGDPRNRYWTGLRRHTHRYFQAEVYRLAGRLVTTEALRSVLDAGCGPGHKLDRYLGPHVETLVGVDQLSCAAHWPETGRRASYRVVDLRSAGVSLNRTFDLVMAVDVIEHLEDPDRLLDFMRAHRSERARFLLSTPDRETLRGPHNLESPKAEHLREWTRPELRRYLASRGFVVERQLLVDSYDMGGSVVMWSYRARDLLTGTHRVHTQVAIGIIE